jgi:PAS domain S-box-containing protein
MMLEEYNEWMPAEDLRANLAAILESSDDAIIGRTLQGFITSWNKSAEKLFGYEASEIIGQSVNILVPPDRRVEAIEILERLYRGEQIEQFKTVRLKKDGTRFAVSLTLSPIKDITGRIIGAYKIVRDISGQKSYEGVLDGSDAMFRSLLENLPAAVYTCDADGLITYFNIRAAQLWKRVPKLNDPEERFCGSCQLFSADGEPIPHDRSLMARALKEDKEFSGCEIIMARPDGSRLSVLAHITPIHDDSGKLLGAVNLLIDIDDRKRVEMEREELLGKERAARVEAENANRSKTEFLSLVSYELRARLNSIIGYSRILRSNQNDLMEIRRACDIIERNARAQLRHAEDLLDTTQIVSGRLRLDRHPTDIVSILADSLDVIRMEAKEKGIELFAYYSPKKEAVIGDAVRLQQVFWNLLSNAVKHTPRGGRIELWLDRKGDQANIIIKDTGIGIKPEYLPHIFDRSRRTDPSDTYERGGLGIGLALVKTLVEMHGGAIRAASGGPGRGSTFTVTLPLADETEFCSHNLPAIKTEEVIQPEAVLQMFDRAMIEGARVLVVDDQEEARVTVADFLRKSGAIVTAVSSGNAALSILDDPPGGERPEVLICDIAMPDIDGYTVLKRVRELEAKRGLSASQEIPAVALTGLAETEDRMRALSAGFRMHLTKPVEPTELMVVIANLMGEQSDGMLCR